MKTCKNLLFCLLLMLPALYSCQEKERETTYPQTTVLGERVCTGTLVSLPNPPHSTSEPTLPGLVLGLETPSGNYILSVDGHWLVDETVTIADARYSVGDAVGISGTASSVKISAAEEYLELTVKSITKGATP